jgi:hypothetical protein
MRRSPERTPFGLGGAAAKNRLTRVRLELCDEADAAALDKWRWRWVHQLADGRENGGDGLIVIGELFEHQRGLERLPDGGGELGVTFRAAVSPLRSALPASRKPRVTNPWSPAFNGGTAAAAAVPVAA